MNFFKRLFKIGQAEAHSAVDALENPIKLTEQGIRDMKTDLDKSLHALAEVKALAIRSRNEVEIQQSRATDYESKAMIILKKGQAGEMEAAEADRLASEALLKKKQSIELSLRAQKDQAQFDKNVEALEVNVKKIRSNISKWENELKTLKARVKVAGATKNLNKQLAQIDGSSTVAMLERMKDKVAEEEALAESYGEIAAETRSIDEELELATSGSSELAVSEDLEAMKKKMGLGA